MTRKSLLLLVVCCMASFLLLAGCSAAPPQTESSDVLPESSAEQSEKSESPSELRARRQEAVENLRGEYQDQIEAETLNKMIGKEKSSTAHEKLFQNDEKAYLDLVRLNFNDILPFRTEGSLIGPKAPADIEDARAYLKEEFKANITDDNRDTFENALKMMESESGSQSPTPYAEYAQKNFDWARRNLWGQYGCTVETNPYFYDHP